MLSRERVIAALEFQSPDRVPFTHVWFDGALWAHGQALIDFLQDYPDDFGNRVAGIPIEPEDTFLEYADAWGTVWRRRKDYSAGEVVRPAIADWDRLRNYRFPPEPTAAEWATLSVRAKTPGRDWYALAGWIDTCERLQSLRGTENLFLDIVMDRPELHELLDRLHQRNRRLVEGYIKAGVDGIWLADDWGTQRQLLIDPAIWRRLFKPRYRELIELARDGGLHVFFHTCGWIVDILDDFVELGVNALNAQTPLMPREVLREKLGGRICLFSDVDRQRILPFGTPAEVTAHIKGLIDDFACFNGGLMLRGELEAVWPLENIKAMYHAYRLFCPIR